LGIYSKFIWGDGTLYGQNSKLEFNIDPFTVTAIDYEVTSANEIRPRVDLSWGIPSGTILAFRILRNQDNYPENEEDGFVVVEEYGNAPTYYTAIDQYGNIPLKVNKYAYYAAWIMTTDYTWIPVGHAYCLIPKEHNVSTPEGVVLRSSQDKFVELLPKTYSASTGSYLDEVNKDSDLYRFLGGFAFTLDETLTYADLLKPDFDASNLNPNLIAAQAHLLNLGEESWLNLHSQKRLIRDALFLYKNKGTVDAINSAVEAYTGYASTIILSPNVLLSQQDSTFYKGIGNWVAAGCALTSATDTATPTVEGYAIDKTYVGKVVVASTNATIKLGVATPNLVGIPVTGGTDYHFSMYLKAPSSTSNVTVTVKFYDYSGTLIKTETPQVYSPTSSWVKKELTTSAPGATFEVIEAELTSDVITLTTASAHGLTTGDEIVVTTLGYPFNGRVILTSASGTTLTYAAPSAGIDDIDAFFAEGFISEIAANFASIEVKFAAVGTYYLDMIQFADDSDARSADFYEARAVETYLAPTKVNYVDNSSFEQNLNEWSFDASATATRIVETIKVTAGGTHVAQIVTDNTVTTSEAPLVAWSTAGYLEPERYYTFSIWAKASAATTMQLELNFYNPDVGDDNSRTHTYPMSITTSWKRFEVKLFVPSFFLQNSTVTTAKMYGTTNSATIKIDSAQLEPGYGATDYFDGDLPLWGASWTDAVYGSPSMLYRRYEEKTGRLVREIPNILPINTPWYVTSGFENTGFVKSLDFKGVTS
jgi:hypothetical protein